jgi:hypothetical protein
MTMNTINQEHANRMGMQAQPSIMEWLKANIYLGHAATLASIMAIVEDLCKQARINSDFIAVDVSEMYAATIHHRGLNIMKISVKDAPRSVIGMIALLTAIPEGNMTEYIIAGRLIQPNAEINTEKLRGIGVDPISEGGGVDWDELRLWLTLSSFGGDGERLRMKIESYLIERQLTNVPLRFRQGSYRRKARYSQAGCVSIDVVLPPDGDRLATIKIRTVRMEDPVRREYLETDGFSFEFNPEAFITPEEASNMQVQQAGTENANMLQVGKGLDYLPMWAPIDQIVSYDHFVEWLKANAPETIIDDLDQHLKNLDVESMFDGFRFKEVDHPALDAVVKGEKVYGEIKFECLSGGEYHDMDIEFIIGAQEKFGNVGYYEAIVGWPEGATTKIMADTEGKPSKSVPKAGVEVPEKIRMSLFATNGNKRDSDGVRKLQPPQMTMSQDEFVSWFNTNATSTNSLHTLQKLDTIVLSSPAVKNYNSEKLRFFADVRLHAQHAPIGTSDGDSNISGYLDVAVVREVDNRPGEFRQVGLFNFTTRVVQVPDSTTMGEYIDAYIHPDSRGSVTVAIDADQVYTFGQLASDLFQGFDKEGAQNLLNYQSSIRNILRRLYGKEVGPHLHMKAVRVANPVLQNNGTIDPGKITVKVFDQYLGIDQNKPLVSFDLVTGLGSDTFMNRNVELIQGVECKAADELKDRTDAAREQARLDTLKSIGAETEETDETAYLLSSPANADRLKESIAELRRGEAVTKTIYGTGMTTFRSDSFLFFKGTVMGVLPLVSAELADRINDTIEFLDRTYHDTDLKAAFEFKFDDGVELVIEVTEVGGNHIHIGIKL